jgi:hypothetical protein
MQLGRFHLRISHKAAPSSNDRASLPRTDGPKTSVPFEWTVEISGITLSRIVGLGFLVLATASSAGALLALILVGLHLCPMSLAVDLFRECRLGGLSSGLISVLLSHRSQGRHSHAAPCPHRKLFSNFYAPARTNRGNARSKASRKPGKHMTAGYKMSESNSLTSRPDSKPSSEH